MKQFFTQSFKIQAVEKALSRKNGTTLSQVANDLNIGDSTLNKWITKAKRHEFDDVSSNEISRVTRDKGSKWGQVLPFALSLKIVENLIRI